MKHSESLKNLAGAMHLFHLKMDAIKFDSVNPFFNSKYASLTHILQTIKEPLQESNLVIIQQPTGENGLTTMLIHTESGEFISDTYFMKPDKCTPQGYGSVVTYQRRYCIQSILGLCFEVDDDANEASTPEVKQPAYQTKGDDLPWLNEGTEMFNAAVEKLKSGQTTIQKIGMAFKLSKKVRESLQSYIKN